MSTATAKASASVQPQHSSAANPKNNASRSAPRTAGSDKQSSRNSYPNIADIHPPRERVPMWHVNQLKSEKAGPHATIFLVNGDRYMGEWQHNLKHGRGTFYSEKTGNVYSGEWQADQRHGFGTLSVRLKPGEPIPDDPVHSPASTDPTMDALFGSIFKGNSQENTLALRKVYVGEWVANKRQGHGTHYYPDGSTYEGQWHENERHGWGIMHYKDGSRYEGEWYREQRHGQGVLLLANGDRYEGVWCHDEKEGPGKFIYKSKRQCYEGEWRHNVPKCGTLVDLPPPKPSKRRGPQSPVSPDGIQLGSANGGAPLHPIPPLTLLDADSVLAKERQIMVEQRVQELIHHEQDEIEVTQANASEQVPQEMRDLMPLYYDKSLLDTKALHQRMRRYHENDLTGGAVTTSIKGATTAPLRH